MNVSSLVLLALVASTGAVREHERVAANPIRKVVTMLQQMQHKVEEEGELEKKAYDKFMCWCSNGGKDLQGSIDAADTKVPQVTADIKEAEEQTAQLKDSLKEAQSDRAAAKASMKEATSIREKEAATFGALKDEADTNIAALNKAVAAIEKGAAGAFLQTSGAQVLQKLVRSMQDESDKQEVLSFLSQSAPSGQITGILKQMGDTMNAAHLTPPHPIPPTLKMSATLSARTAMVGQTVSAKTQAKNTVRATPVVCKAGAEKASLASRRSAMSAFAAAAMAASAKPSMAAYGEGANIFGGKPPPSEFIPFAGEGFALLLPDKFNPSRETEFPGTKLRYEDNFDAVSYLTVTANPTSKSSIKDYGSPEKWLAQNSFYLGKTSQVFASKSEGGFAANTVAAASLLEVGEVEKKGKTYYELNVLTRTADGNEGGRHHLISAVVSGGNEYVLKVQVGDKRYFKGLERPSKQVIKSFTVA